MSAARGGSFVELAYHAPELAVLEAFREVEEALRNEYQRIFPNAKRHDLHTMLKAFRDRQVLEPGVGELFRNLMELRNFSAHGKAGRISPAEALEYRALCQRFLEAMRAGLARFTDAAQVIPKAIASDSRVIPGSLQG